MSIKKRILSMCMAAATVASMVDASAVTASAVITVSSTNKGDTPTITWTKNPNATYYTVSVNGHTKSVKSSYTSTTSPTQLTFGQNFITLE